MSRLPRFDSPGAWFHVMNRGIARRVVFPDRLHVRMFLALLARAVRRGELEIHVFCILPTHFHLLVRSPCGELSEALRRVQNEYVRFYNRRARRDGPLFRGRFLSRPVLSDRYRDVLVRYIEENAVKARLVARAADYPYGSAALQARPRRPRWLSTWWVDEVLAGIRQISPSASYASLWGQGCSQAERALVEARVRRPPVRQDDLDDLVGSAPERVQLWMERKARLADGGRAASPLTGAATVDDELARERAAAGPWVQRRPRGPALDVWAVARVGLLSDVAGLTHDETAARLGVTTTVVGRQRTRHRALLQESSYASRLARIAAACLAKTYERSALSVAPRARALPHEARGAGKAEPVEGGV